MSIKNANLPVIPMSSGDMVSGERQGVYLVFIREFFTGTESFIYFIQTHNIIRIQSYPGAWDRDA